MPSAADERWVAENFRTWIQSAGDLVTAVVQFLAALGLEPGRPEHRGRLPVPGSPPPGRTRGRRGPAGAVPGQRRRGRRAGRGPARRLSRQSRSPPRGDAVAGSLDSRESPTMRAFEPTRKRVPKITQEEAAALIRRDWMKPDGTRLIE